MAEYVVSGARLKCTMGTIPASLLVPIPKSLTINGKNVATATDCIPYVNVGCFGKCNIVPTAPKPCTPAGVWVNTSTKVSVDMIPALTEKSKMICPCGAGVISIQSSGQ